MNDKEILKGIQKYFKASEFVGQEVFQKSGVDSWRFIDVRLLEAVLIVRVNLDKRITANNYEAGGAFSQRGLRHNTSSIVKGMTASNRLYLSAHVLGKALDFDVEGMTASEVRLWLVINQDLFPFKIRLEDGVNWVHLDVIQEEKNKKVYLFKP